MRTFLYLLLAAVLLALGACNRRDARLTAASDVMDTAPDSALAILRHIDPSDISGAGNRALYALLLSQAMSKCHIPPATDSIADIAVAYYDRRGADSLRMLAHFYRAVALDAIGNKGEALTEALLTNELAKEQGATYWQARAHELLGDIYYSGYNMEASIRNDSIAYKLFENTGYHVNAAYSLLSLAMAHEHKGDHLLSLAILDTLEMQYQHGDSYLLGHIPCDYIRPLNSLNRSHEAISRLQRALDYWNNDSSEILWPDIAVSYLDLDSLEQAHICLERPLPLDVPEYQSRLSNIKYRYYKECGNVDSALKYLEISRTISNNSIKNAFSKTLSFNESEFIRNIYNQRRIENEKRIIFVLAIISVFIFIICIAFFTYYRSQKRKKAEFTERMLELNESLGEMTLSRDKALDNLNITEKTALEKIQSLQDRIEQMRHDNIDCRPPFLYTHINIINDLCNAYFECSVTKNSQKKLGQLLETELEEMQSEKFREKLRKSIDSQSNGILSNLALDLPKIKDDDLSLFALVFAGFSAKAISIILNIQLSNYYNRLSRLKTKIESLQAEKASYYLDILNQGRFSPK